MSTTPTAKRSAYAAVAALIDECLRNRRVNQVEITTPEGEAMLLELAAISRAMFEASQVKP